MKVLRTIIVFIFLFWPGQGVTATTEVSGSESGSILKKGESLFMHYCAHCHGLKGRGDGYNAEFLEKEPADLSDAKFMGKKRDEQIFRVIHQGGAGVRKSHLMPAFRHTLSEEEIWWLVAFVRSLSVSDFNMPPPENINKDKPAGFQVARKDIEDFSRWFSRGQEQGLIDEGERLFRKKKSCLACHQVEAEEGDDVEGSEEDEEEDQGGAEYEGGQVGPNLIRAGFLYPPEWLYVWLKNPQRLKPDTKMPNLGLDQEETRKIIAYLANLKGGVGGTPEGWLPFLAFQGNAENGKRLFFDEKTPAGCVKCHTVNDEGGVVGPNLSYIGAARTLPFLLESILEPNKVITTGFAKVTLMFKEKYRGKKTLTGTMVNEDESSIDLIDKEGQAHHLSRDSIKRVFHLPSPMARGKFMKNLTVDEIGDILAYLETLRPPFMADANSTLQGHTLSMGGS